MQTASSWLSKPLSNPIHVHEHINKQSDSPDTTTTSSPTVLQMAGWSEYVYVDCSLALKVRRD